MRTHFSLLATAGLMLVGASAQAQISFVSWLDGASERPNPVHTSARGYATGTLSGGPGNYVFTYTLSFWDLSGDLQMGHIHVGPPEGTGPVRHFLDGLMMGVRADVLNGDWRFDDNPLPLTDALAQSLLSGNTYFNLHTTTFPGGEIRGQIVAVPEPGVMPLLATGALVLGGAARRRQRK
jgi:hypothetical protein